ncbi:LuxR C-terminal-related transcriptional regulator [Kineococcus sp. NUM-3379]
MELLEDVDRGEQDVVGLAALRRLVPGELVAAVEVDLRARDFRVLEVPDMLVPFARRTGQESLFMTSPALPHLLEHRVLGASRVEDLCAPDTWAENPMRRHLLQPHGVPHALLTARLEADGIVRGWGVNRSRPFSDEERAALDAFEPFLRRAAVGRARAQLIADLDHAVAAGAGLVVFRGDQAAHVNATARGLLEQHGVRLEAVLRSCRAHLHGGDRTIALRTGRGVLRLRWCPARPGARAVVVSEAPAAPEGALSRRQHAVLCYLAHGMTAAAIAHQLGLSARTVEKHLENLYRRLGATDRLDAVLKGHARGLLPVAHDCARLVGDT